MRRSLVTSVVSLLVLAALLCVPAQADEPSAKPVIVVSCAGYDAMLANVACIGEIADRPGLDKGIDALVKMFTNGRGFAGVDTGKPCGELVLREPALLPRRLDSRSCNVLIRNVHVGQLTRLYVKMCSIMEHLLWIQMVIGQIGWVLTVWKDL